MATSFPIEKLRGSPSSRKTLDGMEIRCKRMPENEHLCRRVYERLQFLHEPVANADEAIRRKYVAVVVSLLTLMQRTPLLSRLASNETLLHNIKGLQEKLDDVQTALKLADSPQMTQWREQWEGDRAEQYQKLLQRVPKTSERMLVNEIRGDQKLQEVLMTLKSGSTWDGQMPEMIELKQETYQRVLACKHENGLEVFDWFIPSDNVDYEDQAIGEQGTFGDVCRGTWLHNDVRTNVVVKRLFGEGGGDAEQSFLKQLKLWRSIPDDKHILKLYGGSHVSSPQFYVCENAPHGNLADFLDGNLTFFWQTFLDVAEGLKVLHAQDTVHGGLKCNNILIGADYTAKLTDFGFSSVRTLSAGLSAGAAVASKKAIRWKPKEVLQEAGNEEPQFASDIYSMGMCMIEAITHTAPFEMADDESVMEKIMKDEMPERPEDATDEMWDMITRLCSPDPTERPPLEVVLKELNARATEERKLHPLPCAPALRSTGSGEIQATASA